MPVTLVPETGLGVAGANTFLSLADATTRLGNFVFGAGWTDVDATVQAQALIEATSWFGWQRWKGTLSFPLVQTLIFPRTGLVTPDGTELAGNALPEFLLDACARLALNIGVQTATPYGDTGLAPDTPLKIGPITLTPASATSVLTADVRALVAPYLRHPSNQLIRC